MYHHISTGLYIVTWRFVIHFLFPLALRPNAGYIFLIHEIYRSHTTTHHALVWTSDQLFAETSTWQHTPLTETDIYELAGFELTISAGERPQTSALDRAATGIGCVIHNPYIYAHAEEALLSGPQNQRCNYRTRLENCTKHLTYKYVFENKLFPTTEFQLRQHVGAVGCRTSFSGPISKFVYDILQITSGSIQICGGCTERTCTPLATGLTTQKSWFSSYRMPHLRNISGVIVEHHNTWNVVWMSQFI